MVVRVLIGMLVGGIGGWCLGAVYGCWYGVNENTDVVKWVSVIKGIAKVVNS